MSDQNTNLDSIMATATDRLEGKKEAPKPAPQKAPEKAATAKKTTPKGKGKGTAKKAATKAQKAPKGRTLHTTAKGSPYGPITSSRTAFSAYTLAAFAVAGAVEYTAKGTPTKPRRKYAPHTLRALVGATAFRHWTKTTNRIDDEGLTANGLNEVSRRLAGEGQYRTTADSVHAMRRAIEGKSETVEVEGKTFTLKQEIKA